MASVSEEIVREYLEMNEFSVKIQRKFFPTGSERDELDELDLVAINLKQPSQAPETVLLGRGDIRYVERIVAGVRGWHSETFSPSRIKSSPEILNVAMPDEQKVSDRFFKGQSFSRVLVVPSLPVDAEIKEKALQLLRSRGVDYVLEFKTILEELIDMVYIHRNYAESSTLQLIRILKRYDLFRDYQMEFF